MTPTSRIERRTLRLSHPATSAGFTLLELLIVCAVVALALGITMPTLRGDGGSFRGEVRKVVATLNFARRAAIVEATPWTAALRALDPDAPDYAERKAQLDGLDTSTATPWLSESVQLQYQLDENANGETLDGVDIAFFPQGGSTGGILTLTRANLSARVRVDPITGRIATAYGSEDFDAPR